MIKYIIFDFDGTIADTSKLTLAIAKNIAKEYGIIVNVNEVRSLGFRGTLKKHKFPLWRVPGAVRKAKKRLALQMDNAKVYKDMKLVLSNLSRSHKLGILSTNASDIIEDFLERHDVYLFKFVYGDTSVFRKKAALKRLCREQKIDPSEAVYIGDEDRDMKAAKRTGMIAIGVTWGWNTASRLQEGGADYIVHTPKELLKLLS